MLDAVPLGLLSALTPSALLGLCLFSIITGRLVPVKTHERELLVRDQQITYLRAALDACREADGRRTNQVSELLEHSRVTTAIIRSLPSDIVDGEVTA